MQPDLPTKLLDSEVIPLDKAVDKEGPDILSPEFSHPQKYSDSLFVLPLSHNHSKGAVEVKNKHEELELSSAGSDSYPQKYSDSSFVLPLSSNHPKGAFEDENKHEGLEQSSAGIDEIAKLLTPRSNVSNLEHQNQLGSNLINNGVRKGSSSSADGVGCRVGSAHGGLAGAASSAIQIQG